MTDVNKNDTRFSEDTKQMIYYGNDNTDNPYVSDVVPVSNNDSSNSGRGCFRSAPIAVCMLRPVAVGDCYNV